MNHTTCNCDPRSLVGKALMGDADLPTCPVHRPDAGTAGDAIALNNDHALAARLGMTLSNKEH
jgi:hypothetical protein